MKKIKIMVVVLVIFVFIFLLYLFTRDTFVSDNIINIDYKENDIDFEQMDKTYITFEKDSIDVDGGGTVVEGATITLKSGGSYYLSGTLDNGGVIVDSSDDVYIILNGVDITNEDSSAIYVKNAKTTYIHISDNTVNNLTDGTVYEIDDSEDIDATIYSKDDLVIMGSGTLNINANYNHGIHSKDYIQILGGVININSKNEGIKGKDYVAIKDGEINIISESDGIQATNEEDSTLGYIAIDGGVIHIDSSGDGIYAITKLSITGGNFTIKTGGGSSNSSNQDSWGNWGNINNTSAKGLKASESIVIEGGTFEIDSSDDAIHSNGSVVINEGEFWISSGDDGIHSDTSLVIDGGKIEIVKSYEGLESLEITINNGDIHLIASDDGLNAAGGNDSSSMNGRPGQNPMSSGKGKIIINGGSIYVNSSGDGIDANGSVLITDGMVLVDGPVDSGNGALDFDTSFIINGGIVVAVGASGMNQNPSSNSSQNIISINFSTSKNANEIVNITDSSGNEIISYAPSKRYQSVIISTPDIETGNSYKIYSGGSYSTSSSNGLYSNGIYSNGTLYTDVSVTNILTVVGNQAGIPSFGGRR